MDTDLDMNSNSITEIDDANMTRLNISSDAIIGGKVGIGTTTPQNTLNVIGDANITGTIFTSDLNISNSSFSFMDDENSSIRFDITNKNSGSNATAIITTMNNLGNYMGIGIGSSNYILGSVLRANVTGLFSRSKGDMVFLNFYNQAFSWFINPLDDNDPVNLVEIMRLDGDGLNVTGNVTAKNVFIPQYIFPHTAITQNLTGASTWTNITFDEEETAIKFGITHVHDDWTNTTFTINEDGIYDISFNIDVIDTSASSTDIDVAGRVIYINGTEIVGSVFETDITKKNIETEISHEFLANLGVGDKIVLQYVAADADVEASTHGTFGTHPDAATLVIKKMANLP